MKKFKKLTLLLAGIVGVTAPLAGCNKQDPGEEQKDVAVASINVDVSSVNLEPNQTKTLGVTVLPENATNKGVTYTSSDSTIASVSNEGVITALKDGVCIITVQSAANSSLSKQVVVTVATPNVPVTSIDVDTTEVELAPGQTKTIDTTVLPENATNKTVTYTSLNKAVATVSEDGVITAVKDGQCAIIVQSAANPTLSKQITVNVKTPHTDVEKIEVNKTVIDMVEGDTETISVTVLPENATNKSVSFSTKDTDIVEVSAQGIITAKAPGKAVIIVKSVDNGAIFEQVTVNVARNHVDVESINVSETSLTATVGETIPLSVTVSPAEATNKALTWESSNEEVATVNAQGIVTTKAIGSASITVKSVDNPACFKVITINVAEHVTSVTGVTLNKTSLNIAINAGKQTLIATVAPEDASNKALIWSSSNEDVAVVTVNGEVLPQKAGTATITVKTVDGNFEATCDVTITKVELNTITLNETSINFSIAATGSDKQKQLTATLNPTEPTFTKVNWTSTDETVATVTSTGLVEMVGIGKCSIIATHEDSGKTAVCQVEVKKVDLISISLNEQNLEFSMDATGSDRQKQLTVTLNPEETTFTKVNWTSTDENVATVTSTGLVEMVGEGECEIYATHEDSNKWAKCEVKVNKVAATAISLDQSELYFLTTSGDATKQLTATLTPENVTHKELTWSSSDTSVATVDSTGLVTRVGEGEATITVKHTDSNLEATCDVYVTESSVYTIRGVQPAANYVKYNQNKGEKVNPLTEFVDHDLTYKVGDDNKLSFAPVLKLYKGKQQVSQDLYEGGYNFSVEKKVNASYVPADASEFEVTEKTAEIDFAESAIGNSYKLTVCPKDIDEEDIEDFTQVYLVEVIDGYNVTKEEELSLFDTTTNTYSYQDKNLYSAWEGFKEEHGINKGLHPSTLILHKDLMITKDKLPANLFYSEADAANYGWGESDKKDIGTLKDYVYLFVKNTEGNVKITGNYFAIDWSQVPLVTRPGTQGGDPTKKLNSHSSVFRIENGSMDFENVNLIGNAHVAKTDADIKFDGGLIGFKVYDKTSVVRFKNILEHGCYIGIMTEGGKESTDKDVSDVYIEDSKFYDNNNSFLYNWGGIMNVKNSLFEGCGGPVVIQDHSRVANPEAELAYDYIDEANGKFVINGCHPKTVFEDCTINNYVIGTESWFKSFGAEMIAPTIKSMSDTLYQANDTAGRTFVYDTDQKGVVTLMATTDTVMNFIVLNKSSAAEALTAYPVDGEVIFIKNGEVVEDFNYFRPTDMADASEPELNRFTAEATFNQYFRGVQAAGSPVFETTGGAYCIANQSPLTLATVDSTAIHGLNKDYPLNTDVASVVSGAKDHIAVYYQGMMLVFELGYIGK